MLINLLVCVSLAHAALAKNSTPKCDCADNVCTITPPDGSKAPCYQGDNEHTDKCFESDPLLVDGVTKQCGTCEQFGYSTYIHNDPFIGRWSCIRSQALTALLLRKAVYYTRKIMFPNVICGQTSRMSICAPMLTRPRRSYALAIFSKILSSLISVNRKNLLLVERLNTALIY